VIGVTFSIKFDDDYSNRYQKLYEAFRRFGIAKDRTTSCVFLNTDDIKAVDIALYGALDYRKDKAVTFTAYSHLMVDFGPT